MHPTAEIIIDEDGTLDKCGICGLRTKDLRKHRNSKTCKQAKRRRDNERKQDEQAIAENVTFNINGKKLERVREFKYLGRIFTEDDRDTMYRREFKKREKEME